MVYLSYIYILQSHYFDLNNDERQLVDNKEYDHVKVHFILQLGYFKQKQRLFTFKLEAVKQDMRYVCKRYLIGPISSINLPSRNTIKKNNEEILNLMGYSISNEEGIAFATSKVAEIMKTTSCPKKILGSHHPW